MKAIVFFSGNRCIGVQVVPVIHCSGYICDHVEIQEIDSDAMPTRRINES